jgi:hypothetical protein
MAVTRNQRRRADHRGARGSLAGTGPPAPAPLRLTRESLATQLRSLNTLRNYRQVD